MEKLIVTVKDKHEMQLVSDLLKRMRISTKPLTEEQCEDLGLTMMIHEADRTEKVSREQVMRKLRGE
jgi:hypothetical protein